MLLKAALLVVLALIQTVDSSNPPSEISVSERYTFRTQKSGGSKPRVEAVEVAPDGSKVAVATSQGLIFGNATDGQILTRFNHSPFSMAFSNDSQRLTTVGRRESKQYQLNPLGEIPSSFSRPQGYLGVELAEKNGKLVVASVQSGSSGAEYDRLEGAELIGFGEGSGTSVQSVIGQPLKRVLGMLDGPANTKVTFSIIPRGKIEETNITLTRMVILQGGKYGAMPAREQSQAVAVCMSDGFHEFRSSRNGNYVSSIRCEQIKNDAGDKGTSKDGKLFAFVSEYLNPEEAKIYLADKSGTGSVKAAPGTVGGSAAFPLGYKQNDSKIFGVEIYNLQTQELAASFPVALDELRRSGKYFTGVHVDSETNRLVTLTSSTIHLYDIATGTRTAKIRPAKDDSIFYKSLSVVGDLAAVGDNRGIVRIINLKTEQVLAEIPSREKRDVTHVDLSADAKVLTYHNDGVVHVVHLSSTE